MADELVASGQAGQRARGVGFACKLGWGGCYDFGAVYEGVGLGTGRDGSVFCAGAEGYAG